MLRKILKAISELIRSISLNERVEWMDPLIILDNPSIISVYLTFPKRFVFRKMSLYLIYENQRRSNYKSKTIKDSI